MILDQDWLKTAATRRLCDALTVEGAQLFFVGGCVRNALMGEVVTDLDLCTDARPEDTMARAKAAGLKAIPTGIDHGTITVVVDGTPFEITTFRKDVETDGRRAVVAFSKDIREDAQRRDFTMNALYARPNGEVVDPLGGLDDLRARHVRFIGKAQDRICEDYLRTLRYFRFHAWYGAPGEGFDPEALSAIADTLEGLENLSRERVGSELLKLLAAPDPAPAIATMRQIGVLAQILPGAEDRALAPLVHLSQSRDSLLRLAALGGADLQNRLRLSNAQAVRVARLRELATGTMGAAEIAWRESAEFARDAMALRAALLEQPPAPETEADIAKGAAAAFPVTARDLIADYQGAALGARLKTLQQVWIDSGFTLDHTALLQHP